MKKLLLTLATILFVAYGWGQTISTEAPSVSAGGSTVDKNVFQIESTFTHTESQSTPPYEDQNFSIPNLLIRFGIVNGLELRFGIAPVFVRSTYLPENLLDNRYKIENTSIGIKYHIINKEKTDLSIIGQYNYPTFNQIGDKFYSDEIHGGTSILAFSHSLNEKNSFGVNLGSSYNRKKTIYFDNSGIFAGNGSERYLTLSSSIIYNYSFSDKWTIFCETFGSLLQITNKFEKEILTQSDFSSIIGFDTGVLFLLKDHIQLDAVLGYDLTSESLFQSLGFNIMF